jgi:3-vinyl bacteriochlorophyllide hydratase
MLFLGRPPPQAGTRRLAAPAVAPGAPRAAAPRRHRPLYTAEERRRRDGTRWTLVQGVLAPLQFAVFAVSLWLVLRCLATGEGWWAASVSFVVKTALLYTIMVTGCLWERAVFGRWLFAPAFFWEDVFSIVVLVLHTACLFALFTGTLSPRAQMGLALAAYAAYVVNAAQFLLKLRAARLEATAGVPAAAGVPHAVSPAAPAAAAPGGVA